MEAVRPPPYCDMICWISWLTEDVFHMRSLLFLRGASCIPTFSQHLGVSKEEIAQHYQDLVDTNHVTPAMDPRNGDCVLWINRGEPGNPIGKIIRRFLSPTPGPERCPHCGSRLPRVLRAAKHESDLPRWEPLAWHPIEGSLTLVGWKIPCPECGKEAKIFFPLRIGNYFGGDEDQS